MATDERDERPEDVALPRHDRSQDNVTIAKDGRRLDTPEKLIAWLDEHNASRAEEPET
jgi:aminoglycoside phosphotransferase (APT) family kinase protein